MKRSKRGMRVTTLFTDIGGVLLTNGWDHNSRRAAADQFQLDCAEMESLHHTAFDALERGKITLKQYLDLVVFHKKRPFTRARFERFMYAQSEALPEMLGYMARLKARHHLKIAVVSNEGRELNAHRIRKFKLDGFVDFFVSSCFVQIRKPEPSMFRLALDMSQADPGEVVYIENTPMFVKIAEDLSIPSILHTDYESTRAELDSMGLRLD